MWSLHARHMDGATANGLFPSARNRDATCQLRPLTRSWLSCGARASVPLRSLCLPRSQGTRACDARAPCRAGCSPFVHRTRLPHSREDSLQRCKTVLRRASCSLQHTVGFRMARTRAFHSARCLSGGEATRVLATGARGAALVVVAPRTEQNKATATAKGRSPSAQDRAATCQLRPPTHSRLSHGAHASAPLRSLSMGRWRSTHACEEHVRYRAGCSRSVRYTRLPHRREASLQRCKTVLRHASCALQHTAGFRVARTRACHSARCLSGGGATRVLATRARGAALVVVALRTVQSHCNGERPLSLSARPCCDVPAAASNT